MQDQPQPLVVLMEDDLIHTPENSFCMVNPSCGCQSDQEVTDGLLTQQEATRLLLGQQL